MSEAADPRAAPALLYLVGRLRRAGLPISVGQYIEGLRALELIEEPFAYLAPVARSRVRSSSDINRHRRMSRDRLVWLVQTLWARSPEECEIVRKVVETEIPAVSSAHALRLSVALNGQDPQALRPAEPAPRPPPEESARAGEGEEDDEGRGGRRGGESPSEKLPHETREPPADAAGAQVALPEITDTGLASSHGFEFAEARLISPLWLTALWRRFQEPRYVEDRSRIDVDRTVAQTVRSGGLPSLVHARRRENAARMLVFIDAGAAMAPWRDFARELARTLAPDNSRLEKVTIRYFSGAPGHQVYRQPELTGPSPLAADLAENEATPVLVFGEAGAARAPRADFEARLTDFLSATLAHEARPLVWINAMPRTRWQPGFRRLIDGFAHSQALPLGRETLLQAVDILRGQGR